MKRLALAVMLAFSLCTSAWTSQAYSAPEIKQMKDGSLLLNAEAVAAIKSTLQKQEEMVQQVMQRMLEMQEELKVAEGTRCI